MLSSSSLGMSLSMNTSIPNLFMLIMVSLSPLGLFLNTCFTLSSPSLGMSLSMNTSIPSLCISSIACANSHG